MQLFSVIPQPLGKTSSPTFTGLTLSSLTQGSVPFAGAGGVISQDNDKIFWDATNFSLGIGTDTPLRVVHVETTGRSAAIVFDRTDGTFGVLGFGTAGGGFFFDETASFSIGRINDIGDTGPTNDFNISSAGRIGFHESNPETLTEWTSDFPNLTYHSSRQIDSDGGRATNLRFKGEQSGGEETVLANINVSHDGSSDDEKGKIERYINTGSDGDTPTLAETIDSSLDVFWTKAKITAIGGYAIKLTNNTGVNSVEGQIVEADNTDENSYKTADANALDPIGVVYNAGVADGSEVWIVIAGIAEVLLDAGGCVHHDRLVTSATAGSADVSNTPAVAVHFQEIGHAIETVVGAGLAKAVIHFL